MAGHRGRAAIEEVDEAVVAQDAHVPAEIVVVAGVGLGDRRRDAGRCRHEDGVEPGREPFDFTDELSPQVAESQVIGGGDALAEENALAHARIVFADALLVGAVDVVRLGTGIAAALEVLALAVELRHRLLADERPCL